MPQQEIIFQEAALAVLKNHFGEIRASKVHYTWGKRVVVEAATDQYPEGVVLKASAERSVKTEVSTARLAGQASVPVPLILAEGIDERLPGQDWFVMSKAEGQTWLSASQTDEQLARTLDEIGHIFALLHSVKLQGYGPLKPGQGGTYPTWSGWLLAELRRASQPLVQAGHLFPDFLADTQSVMEALAPELEILPPALVHGDLGDGEIFVDPGSGAVTAIVDWGDSLSGDPRFDFAHFVAGGPADDPRPARYHPAVKQAYVKYSGCDPTYLDTRIADLYAMHNSVCNACWSLREIPQWIDALCAHATSLLTNLMQQV
jgi:aminoglycoside phosphotransferase (APT) family kinase protein